MNTRKQAGDPVTPSLPEKISKLSQDAFWLGASAVGGFLGLALWSFNPLDPGWSHAVATSGAVHNWGGRPGAWVADLLLYLFGFSAWWLVLWPFLRLMQSRRCPALAASRQYPPLYLSLPGLALLLSASAVLEFLRFHSHGQPLPLVAGGLIGGELGQLGLRGLGYTAATLCAITLVLLGWRGFSGVSLVRVMESLGEWLEQLALRLSGRAVPMQATPPTNEANPSGVAKGFLALVHQVTGKKGSAPVLPPDQGGPGSPPGGGQPLPDHAALVNTHAIGQESPAMGWSPVGIAAVQEATAQPVAIMTGTTAPDTTFAAPANPVPTSVPAPAPVMAPATPTAAAAPSRIPRRLPLPRQENGSEAEENQLEMVPSSLPPLSLLDPPQHKPLAPADDASLEYMSRQIERKLGDFSIRARVMNPLHGAFITRYELEPGEDSSMAQIREQIHKVVRDLGRALDTVGLRVVDSVPDKTCMALELPNRQRQTLCLHELLSHGSCRNPDNHLPLMLGRDAVNQMPLVLDLSRFGHLLMAGGGGSGRSESLHAILLTLLYRLQPADLRLLLLDTRMQDLTAYSAVPHLLTPIVNNKQRAEKALSWCVGEIERRESLLQHFGLHNLSSLNHEIAAAAGQGEYLPHPETAAMLQKLPYLVIVIDELADLIVTAGKKIDEPLAKIAQLGAAVGVHLIVSTQRPSVDVITSSIKANLQKRLVFKLGSKVESSLLLDRSDAYDCLLGQGDMLFQPARGMVPLRALAPFVSLDEIQRVVTHLKSFGLPNYVEGVLDGNREATLDRNIPQTRLQQEHDALYEKAVKVVLESGRPSCTLLERHLGLSYNRAAALLEQMEQEGLLSPADRRGMRSILATAQSRMLA